MKRSSLLALVACLVCSPAMYAKSQNPLSTSQPMTVVNVQSELEEQPTYFGGDDNPADAPLRSEIYSYNVAVRSDCTTFVTRYQSPYDYFPSAFHPDAQIPAQVSKHEVYFELANGLEMKMAIVSRKRIVAPGCEGKR